MGVYTDYYYEGFSESDVRGDSMAVATKDKFEEQLAQIQTMYEENKADDKLHALVIGDKGVGKTYLYKTCPKPVLLYSFDPGGTQTLRDEIAAGDVVVVPFEKDNPENPTAFGQFFKMFKQHKMSGFFDNFATVGLDSLSTLSDALILQIMKQEGRTLPTIGTSVTGKGMQIQDWGVVSTTMTNLVKQFQTLPVHTLLTGHINRERDEAFGTFLKSLSFPGSSSLRIPQISSEVYYLLAKGNEDKITRHLQVLNNGEFHAGTRLAGLTSQEPPDIKALLDKAGLDSSDKPSLGKSS